jgi:hypothetical protein
MIDHIPWRNRLQTDCSLLEMRVHDFAQMVKDFGTWGADQLPAAYVYPYGDDQIEDNGATARRQRNRFTVAVVIVVRSDSTASEVQYSTLVTARKAVAAALVDALWTPPGCYSSPRYAGGQSEEMRDDCLIWEDRYSADYFINY